MFPSVLDDIRLALRGLVRSPAYSVAAVVTLALGIGANALAYTFANALFLRPMPFVRDRELVGISSTHRAASGDVIDFAVSSIDFLAYVRRNRVFTGIGAIDSHEMALIGAERPETILGATVSASMWSVLGTGPIAGRTFTAQEDNSGVAVAVISQSLQQRLFPGTPAVAIGRMVTVDRVQYSVIGVLPSGFRPRMNPGDVWLPLGANESNATMSRQLQLVARLKAGVSLDAARSDVERIAAALVAERPDTHRDWGASVKGLREKIGDSARTVTLTLMGAVAFLFLLTCANVTNLAMARVARRKIELSTRLALGASRSSLVRSQLIEATLIGVGGGIVGAQLALVGLRPAMRLLTTDNPLLAAVVIDWRVIAMIILLSLGAGVLCSIAPGVFGLSLASGTTLAGTARRQQAGRSERRLRRLLMVTQVSLASVLLVASLAAVETLRELENANVGFRPAALYVARSTLPVTRYRTVQERQRFIGSVLERLRAMPGIQSAALTTAPFARGRHVQNMVTIDQAAREDPVAAEVRRIDPDYFATIGIGITRGRAFAPTDRDSLGPVMIVTESFARQYLGGRNPLGARVTRGKNPTATVVGVVADVMDSGVGEPIGPMIYLPYAQTASAAVSIVARSSLGVTAVDRAMRDAFRQVDPGQPLDTVTPVERLLDDSLGENRFKTLLLAVLSGLAVVVACVGIYGVTAYLVAERSKEVAVRMALGARAGVIVRHFAIDSARWVGAGVVVGLLLAFAVARLLSARLPEIAVAGPGIYAGTALLLLAVGALATVVPTVRASRIAPALVLRGD